MLKKEGMYRNVGALEYHSRRDHHCDYIAKYSHTAVFYRASPGYQLHYFPLLLPTSNRLALMFEYTYIPILDTIPVSRANLLPLIMVSYS